MGGALIPWDLGVDTDLPRVVEVSERLLQPSINDGRVRIERLDRGKTKGCGWWRGRRDWNNLQLILQ